MVLTRAQNLQDAGPMTLRSKPSLTSLFVFGMIVLPLLYVFGAGPALYIVGLLPYNKQVILVGEWLAFPMFWLDENTEFFSSRAGLWYIDYIEWWIALLPDS